MGRVIAVGPGGKPQAPERSDEYRPVVQAVLDTGLLGDLLLSPACQDFDHADEMRRGLYRSAKYYCSCGARNCVYRHKNYPAGDKPAGCPHGGQRVSCRADIVTVTGEDGRKTYHVQFRMLDKATGMRYMVEKYGPDINAWPYSPRAKKRKAGRE